MREAEVYKRLLEITPRVLITMLDGAGGAIQMNERAKDPKDHYVPQFYLNRWSTNGSLFASKVISHTGLLHWSPHSPKETGYERGLYGEVEETFFKPLDNDASKLVVKLYGQRISTSEKLDLSVEQHNIWAKYLLAQIVRVPKYINEICDNYIEAGLTVDQAKKQIPKIIENEKAIKDIRALKWIFARVDSNLELITSDNPIIFKPRNLRNSGCILALPMGPSHFFLATHEQNINRLESNPRKMVAYINQEIINNSIERIYARSKHSINNAFVLKHWKKPT